MAKHHREAPLKKRKNNYLTCSFEVRQLIEQAAIEIESVTEKAAKYNKIVDAAITEGIKKATETLMEQGLLK